MFLLEAQSGTPEHVDVTMTSREIGSWGIVPIYSFDHAAWTQRPAVVYAETGSGSEYNGARRRQVVPDGHICI